MGSSYCLRQNGSKTGCEHDAHPQNNDPWTETDLIGKGFQPKRIYEIT